ncbi:MAG: hypothetical protein AAF889_13165, partial [Cyanobacteria bacterium P01_D01_bin.73]
ATGVAWLKQQLVELRSRLEIERAEDVPDLETLEAKLTKADRKVEKLATKVTKTKQQSKQRKAEIAEWKLWYDGIGKLDKAEEHTKLLAETRWRSEAIATLESKIIQLEAEQLEALTAVEQIEEKIEAVKAGVYELPVDQDPRVVELEGAIARMEQLG